MLQTFLFEKFSNGWSVTKIVAKKERVLCWRCHSHVTPSHTLQSTFSDRTHLKFNPFISNQFSYDIYGPLLLFIRLTIVSRAGAEPFSERAAPRSVRVRKESKIFEQCWYIKRWRKGKKYRITSNGFSLYDIKRRDLWHRGGASKDMNHIFEDFSAR